MTPIATARRISPSGHRFARSSIGDASVEPDVPSFVARSAPAGSEAGFLRGDREGSYEGGQVKAASCRTASDLSALVYTLVIGRLGDLRGEMW